MKKVLFLFCTIFLFAFDNSKINTIIISTKNNIAVIDKNVQKGLTGYVIHNDMMIAKAESLGNNKAKLLPLVSLKNNALATPKINPKQNDKIIFGLYNLRGLIIAPNQYAYLKTKEKYPNINFISSDIFATYFNTKPKKEDFQRFCTNFNVGLLDFILDKEYIVDCNSFSVLSTQKNEKDFNYTKPLFTNYKKLNHSLFESVPNNWITYYKSLFTKDINGN